MGRICYPRQTCSQFGGLVVHFLFQTPMTHFALDVMKAKLGATNAYFGNTIGTCTPSRIVTVLLSHTKQALVCKRNHRISSRRQH